MISEATISGLEERGLEYVLGARERSDSLVRDVVLADERAFTPLLVTRAAGQRPALRQGGARRRPPLHVCRNEAEAEKDRADRQAIVAALEQQCSAATSPSSATPPTDAISAASASGS